MLQRAKEKVLKAVFELEGKICKHLLPLIVGLAHDNFVKNWQPLLTTVGSNIELGKPAFK